MEEEEEEELVVDVPRTTTTASRKSRRQLPHTIASVPSVFVWWVDCINIQTFPEHCIFRPWTIHGASTLAHKQCNFLSYDNLHLYYVYIYCELILLLLLREKQQGALVVVSSLLLVLDVLRARRNVWWLFGYSIQSSPFETRIRMLLVHFKKKGDQGLSSLLRSTADSSFFSPIVVVGTCFVGGGGGGGAL
jgi:hypothetical protein